MSTTKSNRLLSPSLNEAVPTDVDSATPTLCGVPNEDANRNAWQRVIDYQLIEWGWNTDEFDDDGIEPPTRETIQLAIELAERFRRAGLPAPDSVVPDANGGIVFERRENAVSEVFHVWDDGTVEYQRFRGLQLVERWPL